MSRIREATEFPPEVNTQSLPIKDDSSMPKSPTHQLNPELSPTKPSPFLDSPSDNIPLAVVLEKSNNPKGKPDLKNVAKPIKKPLVNFDAPISTSDQATEILLLKAQLKSTAKLLEVRETELHRSKLNVEELNEKLLDKVTECAELSGAKAAMAEELEDLTQKLFEEANSLVANEARQRFDFQTKGELLAKELKETKVILAYEQAQLITLRNRLSETEHEKESLAIQIKANTALSTSILDFSKNSNLQIDPVIFKQFEEIRSNGTKLKFQSIHTLIYMKNTLSDDVEPCLSFGGDPKLSSKKFLYAILDQSAVIESYETPTLSGIVDRMLPTVCSTCGQNPPSNRFKIADVDHDIFTLICNYCRIRLEAVMLFYGFIKNLRQGILNDKSSSQLYLESIDLRRGMFYARIGIDKNVTVSDDQNKI